MVITGIPTKANYFIDPQKLPKGVRLEQIERILEKESARRQKQAEATQRKFETLRSTYRTLRNQILGAEENDRLRKAIQEYQRSLPEDSPVTPTSPQEHSELLEKRIQLRVAAPTLAEQKLREIKALNAATIQEFDAIVEPTLNSGKAISDLIVPDQMPTSISQSNILSAQNAGAVAVYRPGYGWWGWRHLVDYVTGDGQTKRHESFLLPEVGRTGSCVWAKNWSAGDIDVIYLLRDNGFLLGYTAPQNGILRIEIDIQCSICQHRIKTRDELGWSDYTAGTREALSVGLLWNWDDPDLGIEIRDDYFVSGLRGRGDGETSPGTVHPVSTWSKFTLVKFIDNVSLFAGQSAYVYIGTEQRVWASLNDVGCNIFTNGAWFITEIRVQSV